jgi:crotonobetainyl-CoA:carnitine CoA-transferase CaiB-like acyl-CoA transferase
MAHIDELEREIAAITMTATTEEWIDRLDKAGVVGGPVLTYDQTLADPHVVERGMITDVEHPIIGPMRTIAPPTKFSGLDFAVRGPAPWLGQHTAEVLAEAGIDDAEIKQLFDSGVLFDAHPDQPRS